MSVWSHGKRHFRNVKLEVSVAGHARRESAFAELVDAQKRPDHFFSQVFPLSALLQISWLVVESTTSAASRTSM